MKYRGGLSPRMYWHIIVISALLASSCVHVFLQHRALLKSSYLEGDFLLIPEVQYEEEDGSNQNDSTSVNRQTQQKKIEGDLLIPEVQYEEEDKSNQNDNTNVNMQTQQKKPMNILLLYADDWTAKTLGAAGNKVVKTPVLDKLAKEGVRFAENCVTTSICWVSRATLYTGLYMARHNTTMPEEFFVNWKACLYNLLKKHGYVVGHIGKLGIRAPFDEDSVDTYVDDEDWHYKNINDRLWHITEKNEHDSIMFLKNRNKTKPFFLNTAFYATHAVDGDESEQYYPQNRSMSMYRNVTIPTPVTGTQEAWNNMPDFFKEGNEGRNRWHWRYDTPTKFQLMMKNYYRMASEVDSACGAIMEELRRQGELENTLIIFTSDNGNFHGEHGLADKWYPHQESIRVPLIIKDPRMPVDKAGTVNEDLTLNLDLAPTILSAAGIQPPPEMMGRDMANLYLQEDPKWRMDFFYEHPMHTKKEFIPASEALVRKDYKYFFWPDYQLEQLFDLNNDPYEERDVINAKKYKNILNGMRNRFTELKDIVHDMSKTVTL